jgi:inositol phosphorylceramide mannosyltransferase catalytic subunit
MIHKYILLLLFIFVSIIFLILCYCWWCKSNKNIIDTNINNNNKIPKTIHQTYPTKNVNKDIQNNIDTLKRLNPGYEYRLYDDNDIIKFIKNNYDDYILETYNKINPEYGPARTDYFRYLLLYKEGGIYLDIKSSCEKPFNSIIKNDDEYILTHWGIPGIAHNDILNNEYGEYCNWNIIIKKNHPLMKKIIDQITFNINNYSIQEYGVGKPGVLLLTGPISYSKVIIKNKDKYNITLYSNYYDIGLIYSIIENHDKLYKKHYSKLDTPIVLN